MPAPLLIRNARLPGEAAAGTDVLVAERHIAAIGPGLAAPEGAQVINARGQLLAPALIDSCTFATDLAATVAGGIATALLMPDQSPPLDDPALIERAERLGKPRLWVRPLAAATRRLEGRELADLALMQEAGAVAVATGRSALADSAVMLRLLRYAGGLGLVTITHPEDPALAAGTVATEGEMATRLGLPAAPAAAEALAIARDLRLAALANAPLHIVCVTTAEGVALLRAAKAAGQDVTAATAPPYCLLSDTAISGYRSFARLSPPLRTEEDRRAVVAGLADGTIDMLASRHDPRVTDEKRLPFVDAAPGDAGAAILLALGLALVHAGDVPLARLLDAMTAAPARRFGLPGGRLASGAPADLILLDPEAPWRIDSDTLPGLAGNTPFDGFPVQGRVTLLVKGGDILLADGAGR
ncbi:dihydroorotase [Thermaurantiacus sp.]